MSQQKRAKSVRDLFKPFTLYARSAVYATCVLPDAKVELIISDPWWEMLVVVTLGWELQMPITPSFFIRSCFFIHLWFI
jgi:hypothetical protein